MASTLVREQFLITFFFIGLIIVVFKWPTNSPKINKDQLSKIINEHEKRKSQNVNDANFDTEIENLFKKLNDDKII